MLSDIEETLLQPVELFVAAQLKKNKYENVLQHLDNGIVLFNCDGQITFANSLMASLLELRAQDMIGCNIRQLIALPQLRRSKWKWILQVYREMMHNHKTKFEIRDDYGKYWMVLVTYAEDLDGDLLISFKDISDYKRIEETASQNDKLAILGKISAAIAHEIRNPLTAIRGFIQLLRPHLLQLGKDEYARIILMEIDRTNDIIHEFLNSSKPSAPEKAVLRLSSLLRQTVLLTESEALMKDCEISLQSEQEEMLIAIDAKQMKQVFLNLIKNALDAIEEIDGRKGEIHIRAKSEGSNAIISIRDNGSGMEQASLKRLADPFFTTKEKGTGLGLSESYRIIKNHGGSIQVESSIGVGTTFIISLPLAN
ncbi:PAS domain-containing sensor histidine kinase [Paenibacillus yonginensis]|uniref:histidine kinase n=1 Tax=Paenibacillus yonginensis TaxID=1462996 RepID=A0A1B1MWT9_9BACL|nr:ATP-binding protein [Paenibacillus yonginensis]ANS73619.1 PAS domain-containing sensor histidine kinase [Paenibacillus yonginensis]